MSTPAWQPGHLYAPGALVVPRTAPAAGAILPLTNPGFETGDLTGWTVLAGNFVVTDQEQGAFEGQYELTTRHEPEDIIVCDDRAPIRSGDPCTARIYLKPTRSSDRGTVRIYWYDEAGDPLAAREFDENPHNTPGHIQGTGGWRQSTLTKNAPAGAAFFAVGAYIRKHTGSYFGVDLASWHYPVHQPQQGLMYKAVQAAAGYSDTTEPAWPGVLGQEITDNEVTWEAVAISRVVWEAVPTMLSGTGEPDWPTTAGAFVSDGTISWEAVSRRVEDPNCPSSRVTAIVASKVFKTDRDIVRFSATANPLDWTTERDAGYLPTGLQQANANDMAVLNQYRGNLVAFNASSFQMWQVDPDPSAMAILDQMDGIGSSWQGAAQPVAGELFYLSQQGVRTVGIANAAENLAAGDVGTPIDELVQESIDAGIKALSTYYPGAGQYWLSFAIQALTIHGDLEIAALGRPLPPFAYTAKGGVPTYEFRLRGGTSLPPGLELHPDGRVTGTPTESGEFSWQVEVEDSRGEIAWLIDTAGVYAGPSIAGEAPDGMLGTPYDGYEYTVAEGDAAIVSVQIVGGSLPEGLSFDAGVINTGTPEGHAGTFVITLRATDANGLWAEHTDTILIACIPGEIGGVNAGPVMLPDWGDQKEGPTMAADVSDNLHVLSGSSVYPPAEAPNWSQLMPREGDSYHVTKYSHDFTDLGLTAYVNAGLPPYPSDQRIWPLAITPDGWAAVKGANFSGLAIFKNGVFQYATIPFPGSPVGWFYAPSWYSGFDGNGSCWIVGDSVYYGLRQFNGTSGELQARANRIYKWPLDATSTTAATHVLEVLPYSESGGPIFRFSVSRQKNVYVLEYKNKTFRRYDENLSNPVDLPIPQHMLDNFESIRNVGVDESAGMMVFSYLTPGTNNENIYITDLSGTLIADLQLRSSSLSANTRILFTGNNIFIQRANRFYRVDYTPAQCYWRPS